jgi:hypothetical protein
LQVSEDLWKPKATTYFKVIDTLKKFGVTLSPNTTAEHLAPKAAIVQAKAVQTNNNPLAGVSSDEECRRSNVEFAPVITFPSREVQKNLPQMSTIQVSQSTPLCGSHTNAVTPNQKTTGNDLVDNMGAFTIGESDHLLTV